jgi:hypothetical protein
MKRKHQNPKEYSLQHCQERAKERYGLVLQEKDYDAITELLKDEIVGSLFPVFTPTLKKVNQEGAQVTMIVPFQGHKLVAVYDMGSALLKTLLPPEQFEEHLD